MGTKMTPVYTTLTLRYLEERLFTNDSYIKDTYYRYLDDVFVIWAPKNYANYNNFKKKINDISGIQFGYQQKFRKYFNVNIYIRGTLRRTDLYYKRTDTKQYLNFKSHTLVTSNVN